jgi:hypothetical protein
MADKFWYDLMNELLEAVRVISKAQDMVIDAVSDGQDAIAEAKRRGYDDRELDQIASKLAVFRDEAIRAGHKLSEIDDLITGLVHRY